MRKSGGENIHVDKQLSDSDPEYNYECHVQV